MKTKISSTKGLDVLKGGNTKMFAKSGVTPAESGVSAPTKRAGFDKSPPKGGRTGVMGKQGASRAAVAGGVTPAKSGGGDNSWGVHGGSGHMSGPNTAAPARAK